MTKKKKQRQTLRNFTANGPILSVCAHCGWRLLKGGDKEHLEGCPYDKPGDFEVCEVDEKTRTIKIRRI